MVQLRNGFALSRLMSALVGLSLAELSLAAAPLVVTWEDRSDNETGFVVERAGEDGTFVALAQLPPDCTHFADTQLMPAQRYHYRVAAYNPAGVSAYSNVAVGLAPAHNRPPVIEPDLQPAEGSAEGAELGFRISDSDTPEAGWEVLAWPKDPELLDPAASALSGAGAQRRWRLVPRGAAVGTAEVTVLVSDGEHVTYHSWRLPFGKSSVGLLSTTHPEPASRLVNLSTRALTGPGAAGLIVGFTTARQELGVLVRGIGPTLREFGVAGAVENPSLTLREGDGPIAFSRRWAGDEELRTAFALGGAFPLRHWSADAAVWRVLSPGTYSAHLSGWPNRYGVILAEVYEADANEAKGALVNLSSRGYVGRHEEAMHLGFAIAGQRPMTVLLRAIGNTLTRFGVPGALTRPCLKLYRGSELLGQFEGWPLDPDLLRATDQVGAFALAHRADTAALVTLPPGNYTAEISGADERSGIALAEIYVVNP